MGGSDAPMPYTPANQPGADSAYYSTLSGLTGGNQATYNTANTGYNRIYNTQTASPYAAQAQAGSNTAAASGMAAGGTDIANAQTLGSYAPALVQSGFDPQSALYNWDLKGVGDAAKVNNAQAGVAGSPFGAGNVTDAQTNFNMQWQAAQAQKQQQALAALAQLFQGQSDLGATGAQNQAAAAVLPQQTYTDINSQNLAALNALVQGMGNASTPLQNDVSGYGKYLQLGQNATQIADQATQINNASSGILGGLGQLFGMSGLGSSLTSGIGGLFSGASGAAGAGSSLLDFVAAG